MGKVLMKFLKRIVFAFGIIYGINVILNKAGIFIPINIASILVTTLFGMPGLILLFTIFYIL